MLRGIIAIKKRTKFFAYSEAEAFSDKTTMQFPFSVDFELFLSLLYFKLYKI